MADTTPPKDLQGLSDAELKAFLSTLDSEVKERREDSPHDWFSWHDQQRWLFDAPGMTRGSVRVIIALGGNRGGKTAYSKGELARMIRRESHLNGQLTSFNPITGEPRPKRPDEPLTIWVVPPSMQKAREDWISPSDGFGVKYWLGDRFVHRRKSPDHIFYSRPPGLPEPTNKEEISDSYLEKCDRVIMKSCEQDVLAFESSECDAVFFDEEPKGEHGREIVQSCLMRIGTSNGALIFSFTPLNGLSWSYDKWFKPLVVEKRARVYGGRRWIYDPEKGRTVIIAQMGTRDNPRAREYADEVEADPTMTEAEKNARLYGQYGYVEGALFPNLAGLDVDSPNSEHELFVVDRLPGDPAESGSDYKTPNGRVPGRLNQWWIVMDPNKSFGAILATMDQDGNLYMVRSHLKERWPDRKHAEAFKKMEKKWARGRVNYHHDPGSAGAHSAINLADFGIHSTAIEKGAGSVSASIKRLRGLTHIDKDHRHPITGEMGAPRIYFYRPGLVETFEDEGRAVRGSRLADQLSQARQSDRENAPPDTPHKDIKNKLDLFDCCRYLAMLAAPMASDDDDRDTAPDHNRLPRDRDLKKDKVDLADRDFWSPSYSTRTH